MPKRTAPKARLSVSLSGAQKAALQELANRNDVSLARVVQEAVKEFLERHRDRKVFLFGSTERRK